MFFPFLFDNMQEKNYKKVMHRDTISLVYKHSKLHYTRTNQPLAKYETKKNKKSHILQVIFDLGLERILKTGFQNLVDFEILINSNGVFVFGF